VTVSWETQRLGDVADLQGRIGWKGLTAKEYTQKGPYFLSVHSLNYGDYVDFRDAFHISQQRYDESPEIMLQADDVLICKDGAGIGKVGIVGDLPGQSTINSSLLLIRAKPNILPKYLYHVLQSPYFQRIVQSRLEGATTPHLYQRDIATFPVHLPPFEEQRRIVAVLDEAFAAIAAAGANAEKNFSNARRFLDGYLRILYSSIDAETLPLSTIAEFRNGLNFTGASKGETIKIVGVKDFRDNLNVPTKGLATVETDGTLADVDVLKENDILTVRSNGNKALIGRCMIAGKQSEKMSHSGFTIRIRPTSQAINPQFLCRVLKSPAIREHLVLGGGGANISNLNQKTLAGLQIPLPSFANQSAIVAQQDEMDATILDLRTNIDQKLLALTELKQSLLHLAFTGKLTAQKSRVRMSANDDWTTPESAAQILAFSHSRHVALRRTANFGHVKAQKMLHSVEAIGGLDLGRQPIRDAAGPNDFGHMRRAEAWAKQQGFFEFIERATGGYDFRPLANYRQLVTEAKQRFDNAPAAVKRAVEILVDMDSDWAEIIVTTHAAWNNLILDQATITDDVIVYAARDGWHPSKLRHDKSRFYDALRFLRNESLEPNGSAKRVGGQEALLL